MTISSTALFVTNFPTEPVIIQETMWSLTTSPTCLLINATCVIKLLEQRTNLQITNQEITNPSSIKPHSHNSCIEVQLQYIFFSENLGSELKGFTNQVYLHCITLFVKLKLHHACLCLHIFGPSGVRALPLCIAVERSVRHFCDYFSLFSFFSLPHTFLPEEIVLGF